MIDIHFITWLSRLHRFTIRCGDGRRVDDVGAPHNILPQFQEAIHLDIYPCRNKRCLYVVAAAEKEKGEAVPAGSTLRTRKLTLCDCLAEHSRVGCWK